MFENQSKGWECYQIWQISPKFWKSLGTFERLKQVFGKFLNPLRQIDILLGKFLLLWMAQYWKIIYPSGHTGSRDARRAQTPKFFLSRSVLYQMTFTKNGVTVKTIYVKMDTSLTWRRGCRSSSVDSSAPFILMPRVRVRSTPSML